MPVPRVGIVAGQDFAAPVVAYAPCKTYKGVELHIARLVRIDSGVGSERTRQETGGVQIMDIELQRRMVVASRYAAHDVVARKTEGTTPIGGRRAGRCSDEKSQSSRKATR